MDIGERIKAARIGKGMTQQELGDLVGLQKSAIAKYESGRVVNIKRDMMNKIAEVLEVTPYELYTGLNRTLELALDFNMDDEEARKEYTELTVEHQLLIKYLIKEFKKLNKK